MTARIYLTVAAGDGKLHKLCHFAVCRMLMDGRYPIRHDCPTHKPYEEYLHRCMNDFLDIGGEDYWIHMDNDNPPTKNPLDLIEFDCDLVGLPTPVWANMKKGDRPWYFNALDRVPDGFKPHEDCNGLQQVDAIGSGCFIVSRRVLLELRQQHPFARQWNADGTVAIGGDFSFSDKVRQAGFRIFAHFDYPCHHIHDLNLLEVIQAFTDTATRESISTANS